MIKMTKKESARRILTVFLKYLAHGFLFSLLVVGLVFVFTFVLSLIAVFAAFYTGLAIVLLAIAALAALPLLFSAANIVVTKRLWFPVESGLIGMWVQGAMLLLALLPLSIVVFALSSLLPPPWDTIANIITHSFIDGAIGKYIAGFWEKEPKAI
jgi:hypothetical protein